MNATRITQLVLLALGLTACEQQKLENPLICSDQSQLETSSLQITGATISTAGQSSTYQLNQNVSCHSGTFISWKTIGQPTSSSGSQFKPTFQQPGEYIVSAQVFSKDLPTPVELSFKTVSLVGNFQIIAPQVTGLGQEVTFGLSVPQQFNLQQAVWNFGDGHVSSGSGNVKHSYSGAGQFIIQVALTNTNNEVIHLKHSISVVASNTTNSCLDLLTIAGPSKVPMGTHSTFNLFIPPCLPENIVNIQWHFEDSSEISNGQSVRHVFSKAGNINIKAELLINNQEGAWATLSRTIEVTSSQDEIFLPELPDLPVLCPLGQTMSTTGELYVEKQACGLDGSKNLSFRDQVISECKDIGGTPTWVETSRRKNLVNEGPCTGQSCQINTSSGASTLPDGGQAVFFSQSNPQGTCASVSETRRCNNGQLSGSSTHTQMTCNEGCSAFGSHGTVKRTVVIGQRQVAANCTYEEPNVFDTYTETADQVCQNGQVINTNVKQGEMILPAVCPVYEWLPTEEWSSCSQDCGGQQTRVYKCQSQFGPAADTQRCTKPRPQESRLCDGNPEKVKRSEQMIDTEEAHASALCPANQIGVIVNKREKITHKHYACINHSIQLSHTEESFGPWMEEKYCRKYTPYRCSQDSLNNTEAKARLKWMQKCQSQLPLIKEFLTRFNDVSVDGNGKNANGKKAYDIDSSSRLIYPTFMDHAHSPEKIWTAPKSEKANCEMPSTVYVAAVCVSSCATPEQVLMVADKMQPRYQSFIEALTKNTATVMSLSSLNSTHHLKRTQVDQWVTELVDGEHDILVFKMRSGRELRLTTNHPLLSGGSLAQPQRRGTMQIAESFQVGESLIQVGGSLDEIISMEKQKHYGKVYNLFVKSDKPAHNIVITNGYLNGTAFYQNEGADLVNRQLLRAKLIKGALK